MIQTDKLQDLAFELTSTYFGDFFATQQQASIDRLQAAACFLSVNFLFEQNQNVFCSFSFRNFLHTIADCENDDAEADEGHYGLWLLTVSSKSIDRNRQSNFLLFFFKIKKND